MTVRAQVEGGGHRVWTEDSKVEARRKHEAPSAVATSTLILESFSHAAARLAPPTRCTVVHHLQEENRPRFRALFREQKKTTQNLAALASCMVGNCRMKAQCLLHNSETHGHQMVVYRHLRSRTGQMPALLFLQHPLLSFLSPNVLELEAVPKLGRTDLPLQGLQQGTRHFLLHYPAYLYSRNHYSEMPQSSATYEGLLSNMRSTNLTNQIRGTILRWSRPAKKRGYALFVSGRIENMAGHGSRRLYGPSQVMV